MEKRLLKDTLEHVMISSKFKPKKKNKFNINIYNCPFSKFFYTKNNTFLHPEKNSIYVRLQTV